MRFLLFLIPIAGLGAYAYARQATAPASSGSVPTTAAILNATLHGGSPAQKQAAIASYQAGKGLPASGVYTAATRAALVADGIDNPPAAQAP